MRAVGQGEGRVEIGGVLGGLLGGAEAPGEQPGIVDAVGIEVGDEAVLIAPVPADMLVGINDARRNGHGAVSVPGGREGAKPKWGGEGELLYVELRKSGNDLWAKPWASVPIFLSST